MPDAPDYIRDMDELVRAAIDGSAKSVDERHAIYDAAGLIIQALSIQTEAITQAIRENKQ